MSGAFVSSTPNHPQPPPPTLIHRVVIAGIIVAESQHSVFARRTPPSS